MEKIRLLNRLILYGLFVAAFAYAGYFAGLFLSYKGWGAIYRSRCVLVLRNESQHNPFLRGSFPSYQYHLESAASKCKSDTRIEAVIRELNLDGDIEDAIEREKLRSGIINAIDISIDEDSGDNRLIEVSCVREDPVESRDIVEAVSKLFVSEALIRMKKENLYAIEYLKGKAKNIMKEVADIEDDLFEAAELSEADSESDERRDTNGGDEADTELFRRARKKTLLALYTELANKLNRARIVKQLLFEKGGLDFKVVEPPIVPTQPVEPRPNVFNAKGMVFAGIGALIGLSILVLKKISDANAE